MWITVYCIPAVRIAPYADVHYLCDLNQRRDICITRKRGRLGDFLSDEPDHGMSNAKRHHHLLPPAPSMTVLR